ncbi:MAG TPA: CoB--CoM heterodisulfide reductase iron-sulfur subunit B family protein [Candidatus Sumerlaeota bacterium]|nr:CoB--CoM heterodisulfide reductase iron-sulfur subunit B family protein [Candidatus Sumerlaeota bacterium]HON49510.1 CoB--CoM heterodisulfide reductase iron-sulfur subunit B family protein [Candidatus Sumerlaeota bacterium]HOR64659.1 CoB--CoM heterodisulfide reductase iron-sulfur subunit B family protein [Candidatus Sumerlaeota bacterium]HPL74327.1 CoB--CoM heterodisulfide reductase iron-sulfur subunit B family protein [Candidatus Sumerlaeota bacterium]HRU54124.1 CoB--CoM heterodisulfide red
MKPYALFLGCTIPVRAQNYEISTRKVASALGLELIHIPNFTCCGYPISSLNEMTAEAMAARNLALAEKEGADICAICTACTGVLTEVGKKLAEDEKARAEINKRLKPAGLEYKGTVKVKHFARILHEEVGLKKIANAVTRQLKGLRIAPHYGCHYLKPHEIYEGFDSPEDPRTIDDIIAATGAESVSYMNKTRCCGGALLAVDENLALKITKEKLDQLKALNVDAIGLVCPFCSVMYESNQKKIETTFETSYNLPVLYLPQILGLAMGMDAKDLGFNMNRVKANAALQKAGINV